MGRASIAIEKAPLCRNTSAAPGLIKKESVCYNMERLKLIDMDTDERT